MPEFKLGRYWLARRGGVWYIHWFDKQSGRTKRRSTGESDFQSAQQALAEFAVKHDDIRNQDSSEMPLATVFLRYFEHHACKTISAETAKNALHKWADYFHGCVVTDLTPVRQKAFIESLKRQDYSNGYINRILTTGRAALNYAFKQQEITYAPPIQLLKNPQPRERILSIEESAAIFNHADEPHLFMFCMLAFNTLARPAAILDLSRFQVDTKNNLIYLNPHGREQTKKHRPTLPITKTLLPWLRGCDESHYVNWRGKPLKSIKTTWRKMRARAGLSGDVIPYTIRHTMATEMRRRGVPGWEVAGFLGHSSSDYSTTERYAKFAPDYLGKGVAAIDGYFDELQGLVSRELVKKMRLVK